MSLATRLTALAQAVGADIKTLNTKLNSVTSVLDTWHAVGTTGEPAFQNSWANFGGTASTLAFRKDPFGKVGIRGVLKGGASNTVIFTLPVGYRPPMDIAVEIPTASAANRTFCTITALTGNVSIGTVGTTAQATYLDVVEFDTDSVTSLLVLASGITQPTVAMEAFHTVGAVGEPAFQNSAGSVSGYNVRFRKDPFGKVKLSGVLSVAAGSGDHIVFTLPEEYRPVGNDRSFVCSAGGGTNQQVWVNTTGDVHAPKGITYAYLDDIEFDTETVYAFSVLATTVSPDPVWFSGNGAPASALGKNGDWYVNLVDQSIYQRGVASWQIRISRQIYGPSYFTSLPTAGLTDGQEVYFQNAAMAALGIVWHFRYRASSTSAYKWEFVGGPAWTATLGGPGGTAPGIESTTSTAFADLTTVGPAIALPMAGDYIVDFGVTCRATVVGVGAYSAPVATGHAANQVEASYSEAAVTNTFSDARRQGIILTGVSGTVKLQYKVSSSPTGSAGFFSRDLSIRPIRVTG